MILQICQAKLKCLFETTSQHFKNLKQFHSFLTEFLIQRGEDVCDNLACCLSQTEFAKQFFKKELLYVFFYQFITGFINFLVEDTIRFALFKGSITAAGPKCSTWLWADTSGKKEGSTCIKGPQIGIEHRTHRQYMGHTHYTRWPTKLPHPSCSLLSLSCQPFTSPLEV